ncbi:MaoC/PaaZ C-terminal domain-containing protein [Actinomadura verrucosospora]|uniref:Dehydratase nodulation protein n=1 Tax=Actinomadura verrucosospora TaxID=46165 RepID=A0A7D3W207_ACTVE|nr:MaoC/PaaZ C-terminal domain-containing protein [Actinomadura verrucosospora]QKG24452.1 dehydratase nodulation protein [Actinomadura verrucosospora]
MTYSLADFPGLVGKELFCSDWVLLGNEDEKAFGHATFLREDFLGRPPSNGDPYGERLVSGFLLLSMLVAFHKRELKLDSGGAYGLNYGVDKVRFLHPVLTGQRVRVRATLQDVQEKDAGTRVLTRNVLEVEGADSPAMVADWITFFVQDEAGAKEPADA